MNIKFNLLIATLLLISLPALAVKSKDVIVKPKSFVACYEEALKLLKINPAIKSEFESRNEYESRIAKINTNPDLSFTEYFNVNMYYDAEEGHLSLNDDMRAYGGQWKNDVYTSPTYVTVSVIFKDPTNNKSKPQKEEIHISPKKRLSLLTYNQYSGQMFNYKNGFFKEIASSKSSYRAENIYGISVNVNKVMIWNAMMVPTSDSIFEYVKNKKISANKEYAKDNIKMRLKISGRITDYPSIQFGQHYHEATLDLPLEKHEYTLGAYIDVEKASFIDKSGKEIEIILKENTEEGISVKE